MRSQDLEEQKRPLQNENRASCSMDMRQQTLKAPEYQARLHRL